MRSVPVEYVLGKLLLGFEPPVNEIQIMKEARRHYEELLERHQFEPAISLDDRNTRVPEVVTVLRRWVYAQILDVDELDQGVMFWVAQKGYLLALVQRIESKHPELQKLDIFRPSV